MQRGVNVLRSRAQSASGPQSALTLHSCPAANALHTGGDVVVSHVPNTQLVPSPSVMAQGCPRPGRTWHLLSEPQYPSPVSHSYWSTVQLSPASSGVWHVPVMAAPRSHTRGGAHSAELPHDCPAGSKAVQIPSKRSEQANPDWHSGLESIPQGAFAPPFMMQVAVSTLQVSPAMHRTLEPHC